MLAKVDNTPVLYKWEMRRHRGACNIYHSSGVIKGIDSITMFDGKILATTLTGEGYYLAA